MSKTFQELRWPSPVQGLDQGPLESPGEQAQQFGPTTTTERKVGRTWYKISRKPSKCWELLDPYLAYLDVLAKQAFQWKRSTPTTSYNPRDVELSHITSLSSHIYLSCCSKHRISSKRIPYNSTAIMARLSTVNNPAPDPTAINLTRMIARLQKILISPDHDTESKLRSSSLEREKVGTVSQSGPCSKQICLII